MSKISIFKQVKTWIINQSQLLVFIVLLIVFAAYTIFLAFNLKPGIIPDETHRFSVSEYFVTTWGIPENVPPAQAAGESLNRSSFLGYWIYGRMLALFFAVVPNATEWQSLVFLRLFNAIFSWGTVVFTFFIAKEIIKNKWLQLLPIFMLTHTLMFVFLSGGVNYDNPTIFFCSASLLFFIRVIKKDDFIKNSVAWLIFICIACLIKFSILPLAFIMSLIWVIFIIKNKPEISTDQLTDRTTLIGLIILLALIVANFNIYGVNIIRYQSITPSCTDVYSKEICDVSTYIIRHQEMALPNKLTIFEAFRQGNPEPIRFIFGFWIRDMADRIFGIMGHKIYFPISVSYFIMMIYWSIGLGMRYIRKLNFLITSLICVFLFYSLVLIWMNYNSKLTYGFHTAVALQGRYIFPVIMIAFVLWGYILENVTNKLLRYSTIFSIVALFFYGGPIRFIWYYQTVFADWFI